MNKDAIVSVIIETFNTIFNNLFSSIDNNIYVNLDNITFINSNITKNIYIKKLLSNSNVNSLIHLANALILAVCLYYIVRYYYFNFVDYKIERPVQFFFKVFILGLFLNFSYFLINQLININYLISSAIQEAGSAILAEDVSFAGLIRNINKHSIMQQGNLDFFTFDGILKSFVSIGLLNLLFTYSLRYLLLEVFILFTPFSIISLMDSSTSWIFKTWFRAVFSLLIIQVFVAIVLIVIFIFQDNKVLYVVGIYALIRINSYVRELFGGITLDSSDSFGSIISKIKGA